MQAFPAAISETESDPFLMCDFFGPTKSDGKITDPDKFPVNWHPHRGFDIATYLVEGVGRHADSMGNRQEFASPGMQWCSVGSGIEHAEAGGTPAGENTTGFQLWLNVPSDRKMDDPRYGTVEPSQLPVLTTPSGVRGRILSGLVEGLTGPFATVQPLQMVDYVLPPGAGVTHAVPADMHTSMVFVYAGGGSVNGAAASTHDVALLDATQAGARAITITAGAGGASVMLFAGKRLNQPIAWHGPFVMSTQAELRQTFAEYRSGAFPPKRVPWDYTRLAAFPADHPARRAAAPAAYDGERSLGPDAALPRAAAARQ